MIVPMARVKLQDEIGAVLGARFTLMLLGETTPASALQIASAPISPPAPARTKAMRTGLRF